MINKQQIYQWWDIFKHKQELTEIRVLEGSKTYSGYFTDVESIIKSIEPFADVPHAQIYFTLNYINEACYGRAQHDKLILVKREPTTGDGDITGRTHVLIDIDPKRPAGVSSSNEELEFAHKKAAQIFRFLMEQGFNEPIVCRSGNGYHVILPCKMAANEETKALVKRFLQALSLLFSDDKVEVDEKVFNPSRICKLYGVQARKGENIPDRPWRMSEIIRVPDEVKINDIAYFRKVAGLYPDEEVKPEKWNNWSTERFDLVTFLNRHGINFKTQHIAGGTKYILDHCPFNDQHKNKDAVIFQRDSGAIGFICLHNSCSGKTWKDVRLLFEPDAYDRKYIEKPRVEKKISPIIQTEDKGKVWLKMSDIRKQPFSMNDYIKSGITDIDRRGLGFKRGMVSVWTGKRGCGKSSLMNMLILNAAQNDTKSALWTGELTGDMVKQWLFLQAAGKHHNYRYGETDYFLTEESSVRRIEKWIDRYLWLFNNRYGDNFSQIEEQIKKLVKEEGIDQVILDNLMVLDIRMLEENKYDRQGVLLQRLEDLAKEENIHIHIIAHPHKSIGYIQIDNISGSGDISNKADNVFIMSRVNNDFKASAPDYLDKMQVDTILASGCTNIIEVGKFRAKGTLVGHIVKLWFEEESNRMKNFKAESVIYDWENDGENDLPFEPSNEEVPF